MLKLVGEDDGKVVQAAFAHLTAEIYFLIDAKWKTPQERLLAFLAMQDVGKALAYKPGGLEDLSEEQAVVESAMTLRRRDLDAVRGGEAREHGRPDGGESPQGGGVARQALAVACGGAADGQQADHGAGQQYVERMSRRQARRPGDGAGHDEPAGQAHQQR